MSDLSVEPVSNAPVEKMLEVRPTLFVALGGTGMEVLLRLRRRLLQQPWGPEGDKRRMSGMSEFPVASFLYFDTDTNEARESDRSAAGDSLGAAVQFAQGETLQKRIDVGFYLRELETKPLVREWLKRDSDLSKINTEKGAGQVRSISRLLFFDVYEQFRNAAQQGGAAVLANVENEHQLRRLGFKTQPDLRTVVIASTAGGTGSGSFIDVGYALKELRVGGRSPQVDLFLMLPGGYVGANQERVFANTYAALSELELVSRPNHRPRYVEQWIEYQERVTADTPYDDVFLVDTTNIASQVTGSAGHLFDMMADILAEDFSSSDFARRKRSVAVNQQQHKSQLFYPAMPGGVGARAVGFSRLFSSIGQTILASTGSLEHEATIARAAKRMLTAYFGIALGSSGNLPTPDERDEFTRETMLLQLKSFGDFHPKLPDRPRPVLDYAIVDELLRREGGELIAERLKQEVEQKFREIRTGGNLDPADWPDAADRVRKEIDRDIGGHMESSAGVGARGAEVRDAAERLQRAFLARSGERSLAERFYRRLDHAEKGGYDYTVRLIELVQEQIELPGDGVVARLDRARDEYSALADRYLNTLFSEARQRIQDAGRRKAKQAEIYLDQARDALKYYAELQLRSLACEEASSLLRTVATRLGKPVGTDERHGEVRHDGQIGEFQDGYDAVRATLAVLDDDIRRVDDAVNRPEQGMYVLVKAPGAGDAAITIEEAKTWARFLEAEGGRRSLFEQLRTSDGQLALLNRLRSVAQARLQRHEERIPPVSEALRAMQRDEPGRLRELMSRILARTMPWIGASFDAFKPKAEQYKLLIAVDDAVAFERDFGATVREVIPVAGVMPSFVTSGVPGRITFYCELSGVPLDVLTQLRSNWREAYRRQKSLQGAFPLHNHWDTLRFPDPLIPRQAEVMQLTERLRLFLTGIAYGLLTRDPPGPGGNAPGGQPYRINMGAGDRQSVGSERSIRREPFLPHHLARLKEQIAAFEAELSPVKMLALQALLRHMADRAYAKRRELDSSGREERFGGLGNHAAHAVLGHLQTLWDSLDEPPADFADPDAVRERLYERLNDYTRALKGSLEDLDHYEANQAADDLPELRAQDKRQIDSNRFTDAHLMSLVNPAAAPPPPLLGGAGAPPPPPAGPFFVLGSGGQRGPLPLAALQDEIAGGTLPPTTLVYDQMRSAEGWRPAGGHPILSALFAAVGGPPEPPPPPPSEPAETFWIAERGVQRGPIGADALRAEVLAGTIGGPTKLYSKPAHAAVGWRAASEHPATSDWFDVPPPPPED